MADIELTAAKRTDVTPVFSRSIERLQNGKFNVLIWGAGWWRRFEILYERRTAAEYDAVLAVYNSQAAQTFTFLLDGETITARFQGKPTRIWYPGDKYDIIFSAIEDHSDQTGSASWPFTTSQPASRFVPEHGLTTLTSPGGLTDVGAQYGSRNVGYLEWVTDPISQSEYDTFLDCFNSNQVNEFDVVWPEDTLTYHVWFGQTPFQVARIGSSYVLTIQLQVRGRASTNVLQTIGGQDLETITSPQDIVRIF